ncbi:MAG: FAD-binding protein [Georgfuchsia sp.]
MSLPTRMFDAIVVGAGGSGLRVALELARTNLKVAVLSKVFPSSKRIASPFTLGHARLVQRIGESCPSNSVA